MTIRMALKIIRERAPETEKTFLTIRRNRYCHTVRYWSICDIRKAEKLSYESAERRYYRHLARLHVVFGVSQVGYLWRGATAGSAGFQTAERFRSDGRPLRPQPKKGNRP